MAAGATAATSASGVGAASNSALLAGFSAALASILPSMSTGNASAAARSRLSRVQGSGNTPLSLILQPDAIIAEIRDDPSFAASLLRHLPEGQQSVDQLVDIVSALESYLLSSFLCVYVSVSRIGKSFEIFFQLEVYSTSI